MGLISFSGGILLITLVLWAGLQFVYKPYFDSQTQAIEKQIADQNSQISASDQTTIINFYSELANLRQLLRTHVTTTNLLTWLGQNTEQNTYFSAFSFANGGTVTFTANARTEADANQQIAIFENSPQVKSLTVSGVAQGSGNSYWQFSVTLSLDPSIIASSTTPTS